MAEVISAEKGLSTNSCNTALESVKKGLQSVKISKYDATQLERDLQGELLDKWHEVCEVMKARKIPFDNMPAYLDHMQSAYEGIDANMRKKIEGILFTEAAWDHKIVEWKFGNEDTPGARYGLIAFGRSPDLKYVDCMYVMYKLDFMIAPQRIVTEENHSMLWGLRKWTTHNVEMVKRSLGTKNMKLLQNFFRFKALQGFYQEGLIESISYVDSIDDIPDSMDKN